MRHILAIEYEYCRVYVNTLAMQAVVERCVQNTPGRRRARNSFSSHSGPKPLATPEDGNAIPFSTLARWYGGDRPYIWEVAEGSRAILRIVVEDLRDDLKYVPVRTYFRIISVAIILLKVRFRSVILMILSTALICY